MSSLDIKRKTIHWRGHIKLLSSLSHGAGNRGNIQIFNTEKVLMPDGSTRRLPYVTGNALKHKIIRAPGMDFMLRHLGMEGKLSRACLQVLYSGGFLSAKGSTIDLGRYLELCELIPLLGLLGGALGNVIQESRVSVDTAVLICRENYEAGRLPKPIDELGKARQWLDHEIPAPASAMRSIVGYTRGDKSKQRRALDQMTEGQRALTVGEVDRKNEARRYGEQPEKGSSTQMRHEVEVVCAGARFAWEIRVSDATDIELGAFYSAVAEFCRRPYIGGKSSIGHGKVALTFDDWTIDPRAPIAGTGIERPVWDKYAAHLDSKGDQIREALVSL